MRARILFAFFALVALAFPALAEDRRGEGSLDRVLPEIRRTVPGTFYDAEGPYLTPDGRATYRIKWMTPDGRIIWFTVDARSGHVMGGVPTQQTNPRFRDDANAGWGDRRNNSGNDGDHRNNFGNDDRGWGNDRGGGWGNNRGDADRGNSQDRGGWGNNDHGDRGNDRGWGNDRGNDRGHDRGSWGNDRGGRGGGDRGGDRGGRGGGDHRHGG